MPAHPQPHSILSELSSTSPFQTDSKQPSIMAVEVYSRRRARQAFVKTVIFLLVFVAVDSTEFSDATSPGITCNLALNRPMGRSEGRTSRKLAEGIFLAVPHNRLCSGRDNVQLQCNPERYESIEYHITSKAAVCQVMGQKNVNLPCDDYVVECLYYLNSTYYTSGKVYVSEESIALQPRNVTCYHGNKDAVAVFQCPITLEHVVRIRWQVNGEEHQHTGPELPLSCARELDAAEVTCVVEFKGGNSTYTAGWLNALHSDDENEEESNMSTQECDKKEDQRGTIITLATMAAVFFLLSVGLFIWLVVTAYKGCINMSLDVCHRQKLNKCNFCSYDDPEVTTESSD